MPGLTSSIFLLVQPEPKHVRAPIFIANGINPQGMILSRSLPRDAERCRCPDGLQGRAFNCCACTKGGLRRGRNRGHKAMNINRLSHAWRMKRV